VAVKAEDQKALEMDRGVAQAPPQLIAGHAAVADAAVAVGDQPGEGPLDQRPPAAVVGSELVVAAAARAATSWSSWAVTATARPFLARMQRARSGQPGHSARTSRRPTRGSGGCAGGQVTVRAVWSTVKSSRVNPPGPPAATAAAR